MSSSFVQDSVPIRLPGPVTSGVLAKPHLAQILSVSVHAQPSVTYHTPMEKKDVSLTASLNIAVPLDRTVKVYEVSLGKLRVGNRGIPTRPVSLHLLAIMWYRWAR